MKWLKAPDGPGWYWFKYNPKANPELAPALLGPYMVDVQPEGCRVADHVNPGMSPVTAFQGQWLGPLRVETLELFEGLITSSERLMNVLSKTSVPFDSAAELAIAEGEVRRTLETISAASLK